MESDEENFRLDAKTDRAVVERQALWAGIQPGMRVADLGCGSGKTTAALNALVQPGGEALGLDISEARIQFASDRYAPEGVKFLNRDIRNPLDDLGVFDFVWIRFVLEYHRSDAFDIVRNLSRILRPGGIACLIDLDHNSMNHFEISERLERTFQSLMEELMVKANFDPFAGRKSYSYLYRLGYEELNVHVGAHHLFFGKLPDVDAYNWMTKIAIASRRINFQFTEYSGGYEEFIEEFKAFFYDPGRFTYTPVVSARGRKPSC
jgi:ubiquinone/menaquinone biosynthesis C-methylase UbiE